MKVNFIQIAAIVGATAVAIGAFGAHGLEPILEITSPSKPRYKVNF